MDVEIVSMLSEVFQLMDKRGDGALGKDAGVEFTLAISPTKARAKVDEEWKRRIKAYDINGDGEVRLNEWILYHELMLAKA